MAAWNRKNRSVLQGGGAFRIPLAFVFVMAVLLPSLALSLLALRAANREALYVERRLENALLAEVNHAAGAIAELLRRIGTELETDAEDLSGTGAVALDAWRAQNPLVSVPFALESGRLVVPDPSGAKSRAFRDGFGPFLEGRVELPVYDDIANVYRRQMLDDAVEDTDHASDPSPAAKTAASGGSGRIPEAAPPAGSYHETESGRADEDKVAAIPPAAPRALSNTKTAPVRPLPAPDAAARRKAAERIATDSSLREKTFRKAEDEGFQVLQRNVMPQVQAQTAVAGITGGERSKTVSRGRSFADLSREGSRGMLPRITEAGLDLLFWTRRPAGHVIGCSIDMKELLRRIADTIPDIRSEVRILTVLDENGKPLLAPEAGEAPDWRRPFVAREISPLLPRWEVGAWLADPALVESQARFVTFAVWLLVAILLIVIATGGVVVLRMLSAESRLAMQKTTFVANVSHELKTPLTSIRLFAEMLLQRRQPDERKRDEYLRTMLSEAERLSRLVDNVLAFSRKGSAKTVDVMKPLDLAALARETAAQLEPHLTRSGFALHVDAPDALRVRGNDEALRQVLMNLLSNAEKYSGEAKEIGVTVRLENGECVACVLDRGIGVEPGNAGRIFDEFYRCDDSLASSRSGTGLGLSIARDIARRHGGDVTYAPREGGGSVFALRLPLCAPGTERKGTSE